MRVLFVIIALFGSVVSGVSQTRPRPEIYLMEESFKYYTEWGVNFSVAIKRSIYGKVRILKDNEGPADLRVHIVEPGGIHKFAVKVVNREPKDGEWQFVTKPGEEDFTIRLIYNPLDCYDVSIRIAEGYNPVTKKYVKKEE